VRAKGINAVVVSKLVAAAEPLRCVIEPTLHGSVLLRDSGGVHRCGVGLLAGVAPWNGPA
jgi:hypothetical protein